MQPILFETRTGADGMLLGIASLNSPRTLNALTLPMIRALDAQLQAWEQDPQLACVVLRGMGDKAFCAGGDVRALRTALQGQPPASAIALASSYFAEEYTLDYRIHCYSKPLIAWGHGVVMGGGLGLLAGASHRILCPDSRIAMPEISIGLYPDVGASWFLPRMPAQLGVFLALTGAVLSAADALLTNLADWQLQPEQQEPLLQALCQIHWPQTAAERRASVSTLLSQMDTPAAAPAPIVQHLQSIRQLMQAGSLTSVAQQLENTRFSHPWMQQAQQNFIHGCPGSAALSWEILQRSRHLSLAEALRQELVLSANICARPDFSEGVRALLVDKDRSPRWSRQREQIDQDWIDAHFISPWSPDSHPLRQLGRS